MRPLSKWTHGTRIFMISYKKNFFAIGHITDDLEPSSHLGGGVSYSGFVADRLGYFVHVITKCPPFSRYINKLNRLGITVHRLSDRDLRFEQVITSFRNFFMMKREIVSR